MSARAAPTIRLPRIEVTLAPENTACPYCRAAMTEIGADTSERLDVIPVQFRVIVTRRPKFACRSCPGTVVQVPAPPRLIGEPLVADPRVWFEAQIAKLPARGPTAEAIRCGLDPWAGLEQFLNDGRVELGYQ